MKIAHIVSSVAANCGGTSEVVSRLCEELSQNGHEVRLVSGWSPEIAGAAHKAMDRGVDLRMQKCYRFIVPTSLRFSRGLTREVQRAVSWADVIHVNGMWQWPGWSAVHFARRTGKPYVIQPHGMLRRRALEKSKILKSIVMRVVERSNLRNAQCLVATSEQERDDILECGVTVPVHIVRIGLDSMSLGSVSADKSFLRELGVPGNRKIVLYLSRIDPIKGLDMLAIAWDRLSQFHDKWHLLVVGTGRPRWVNEIRHYYSQGLANGSATFCGPIYGDDKLRLLKSSDIFVLPSRSENFSISIAEALASGLPVVCTKGTPWEVIEKEGAGKWVDVNADAIEAGLKILMKASDAERKTMGLAGQRIIERDFHWKAIGQRMEDIYSKCVDRYKVSK